MLRVVILFITMLLSVSATAQQSRGATVDEMPPASEIKDTHALIVGISEYQSHPRIHNLRFADDDAMAVAAYLKSKAGGFVPQERIIELYNQKATSSAIMGALRLLDARIQDAPAEIKKDDRLIIYLSGHGGAFNVDDSYFFPTNADNAQDAGVAISIRTIKNYIENWRLKGVQVILIFDACRSATIGMGTDGIRKVSEYLEAKRNGEILMVASSKGQEALEYDKIGHGLFTYYLLSGLYGLADKNNDGAIKGFEIAAFLEENISTQSGNKQFPFIDFNDFKSTTFAIVDPVSKAEITKSFSANPQQALTTAQNSSESPATTQGRGVAASPAFAKLESDFEAALVKHQLLKPENESAVFWLKKLQESDPTNSRLEILKLELTSSLLSAAQQVLLNDISGLRLYTRCDPSNPKANRREGYNLDYYADALLALQQYTALTNTKLDDETACLQSYLLARDLIIKTVGTSPSQGKVNMEKARQILNESLARCSGKAFIQLALAQSLDFQAASQKEVIDLSRKAIRLAPSWSFPYNTMGQSFRILNQYDSAEYYYKKAIALNPLDVFPLEGNAHAYVMRGQYEKALGYYLQAYQKDTLQVIILTSLADNYFRLNKSSQGMKYINKALRLDKQYSKAFACLGGYYLNTSKPDSALYYYKQAIRFNPNDPNTQVNAAYALINLGKPEEATSYALKCADLDPQYTHCYRALAYSYGGQGLQELAVENFDKAIELGSTDPSLKLDKGYYFYNAQKYSDAIKQLGTIGVTDAVGNRVLGESYLMTGDIDNAEKFTGQSLALNPNEAWANYVMSRVRATKNQYPEAITLLEDALRLGLDRRVIATTAEYGRLKQTKEFKKAMKDRGIDVY